MPVSFLTPAQRENYGRYAAPPTQDELTRYCHLNDDDLTQIMSCRGEHNRLGFALQLTTVRHLGTFLDDPVAVPSSVLETLSRQLGLTTGEGLQTYRSSKQRWEHITKIREHYGYSDMTEPLVGFRLTRWLYGLCWTGTERPSKLFERATAWLLAHKILLPGCSTLERFVVRLRSRVEIKVWRLLGRGIASEQRKRLEYLLTVPEGSRGSWLDKLRSGPTRVSGPAVRAGIERLKSVRELGITLPAAPRIPESRIAALARFANRAKVTLITRMPPARRLATLAAFVHSLEATAQDDVLEVLEILLHELFGDAEKADKKARLRTLKDLDGAAATLADVCRVLLDPALPDDRVRRRVFEKIPQPLLEHAVENVDALIRPPQDVFYKELDARYAAVRRYLPAVLNHVRFEASPAGKPVVQAYDWLRVNSHGTKPAKNPPQEVITNAWQRYVFRKDSSVDIHAYTFCMLDQLVTALHRRDVFTKPSWRYADPRANLLGESEWEAMRPVVCRTLGLSAQPQPVLDALRAELDRTYREVAQRLPNNPAVRFENINGKEELILSPLEKLEEPVSLVKLREAVAARLPRVDIPEIVVEIAARTGFAEAFTHLTERTARVADLTTSVCAVLTAEACNTGPEPFIRYDNSALRRDRLAWVKQNYVRDDTLTAANAKLISAQNRIALAHVWGGGEVASADGMRFVVPIRTVHAGPNPKYFGQLKGVTWYNLLSDQFTGLNAIPTPGTLRDSLVLLAVVLEQQTELKPTQIMTDTGAYSDVVFGLFRLLGYRFSPRLADIGGTRFWRIDPNADYGKLNVISQHRLRLQRISPHWDDILRLTGSLLLGRVPATGIMRTLQVGDNPTRLAQAIAEFGRIDKTLHTLNMIDDENKRRSTLTQLNRGEGRHSLGRAIFHGKRGELRQRYREGQEDQLGALGLVVNMIVLWNTIYMEAILNQLRLEGYQVYEADVARLSPLIHDHINMLGRYSFAMPETVARGELRPLRNPLSTKNSSYNAAIVADDGLTGLSVPMFPKPHYQAIGQFLDWCQRAGFRGLEDIEPITVAAYVEQHSGSPATIKQHMSAIRMLFSWLTEKGILAMNPAREVKTEKFSRREGKTPAFDTEQVQKVLNKIDTSNDVGLRDRALLDTLAYTFARIGAVVNLKVEDYFQTGKRSMIRFSEKGDKETEIPVHHKLEELLDQYLETSGLKHLPNAPLFPIALGKTRKLGNRPATRIDAARMLKRRLKDAGLSDAFSPHSFRATGITNFLENGGTLEVAQRIAGHADSRTTKLYDRRGQRVLVEDMERIRY